MTFGEKAEFFLKLPGRVARRAYSELKVEQLNFINWHSRAPVIRAGGPAVSLTSYGKRIDTVYLAIESIAQGSLLPSRIILWLDEEARFRCLPVTLERLKKRGLTVQPCKNYGPHKKYYPYVDSQKEFDGPMATADDDILYPKNWLSTLTKEFRQAPTVVNGYRARVISLEGGQIAPYVKWTLCRSTQPSWRHLLNGASGVIYPPKLLSELKRAGDEFENCCPKADDVWLHATALRTGFKIRQVGAKAIHFPMIPGSQANALYFDNTSTGNDIQIAKTYSPWEVQRLTEA